MKETKCFSYVPKSAVSLTLRYYLADRTGTQTGSYASLRKSGRRRRLRKFKLTVNNLSSTAVANLPDSIEVLLYGSKIPYGSCRDPRAGTCVSTLCLGATVENSVYKAGIPPVQELLCLVAGKREYNSMDIRWG